MSALIRQVRATIEEYGLLIPGDCVILGVSGGPDSLCLLHALRELASAYRVTLHAAHLHHGIRGQEADDDARYVAELCAAWGVPCTVEQADVPALARASGLALEEAARQARYAFLARQARNLGGRSVAVAHHADDQVETVLMHLLRGAGLAGLRGMRPLLWLDELRLGDEDISRGRVRLLRPLLYVTRAQIEEYCREHGLQPRFDRSNLDCTYFRNRLRHELIPLLETYNPNLREVLRHTAEAIAGDYDLLRAQLEATWPNVVRAESRDAIVYDLAALRALPPGLQRSVLREGIHRLRRALRNINWVHVDQALAIVRRGNAGMRATLPQGLMLTLGYAEATLASEGYRAPIGEERPRLAAERIAVPLEGRLQLPQSAWSVTTRIVPREALPADWERNPDRYVAYLDAERVRAPLALRTRREGDWFHPLGLSNRRQKLRNFFINSKIPQAERDSVPLLVCGEEIAWVVGWRLDARYAVTPDTRWVLVICFAKKEQGYSEETG